MPIFVSPMVLGFGYVVAAGPVGFFPVGAAADRLCAVEYLLDVQHCGHRRLNPRSARLSISSALRSVGSDVEEAARTVGATPLQVMTSVSLPMVRPSILYACVLLFSSV